MAINPISSYLYNSQITAIDEITSTTNIQSSTAQSVSDTLSKEDIASFSDTLTTEISNITQLTELAGSLNQTVLSDMVNSSTDLAALSKDLLGSTSGRQIMSQLIDSQFIGTVLSGTKDDNQSDTSSLFATDNTSANTQIGKTLDTLQNLVNQLGVSTTEET